MSTNIGRAADMLNIHRGKDELKTCLLLHPICTAFALSFSNVPREFLFLKKQLKIKMKKILVRINQNNNARLTFFPYFFIAVVLLLIFDRNFVNLKQYKYEMHSLDIKTKAVFTETKIKNDGNVFFEMVTRNIQHTYESRLKSS